MFPPEAIRSRAPKRQPAADGGDAAGSEAEESLGRITPPTVQEPSAQRRIKRARTPTPVESAAPKLPLTAAGTVAPAAAMRTLWIGLAVLCVFGASIAAAVTLVTRRGEPEGSGLIVVQAPTPSLAATQPAPASSPPMAAAAVAEAVALDDRSEARPKRAAAAVASARPHKSTAGDPLQLMAAGVADAFSRQKASVIACLNQHASDLDGAPQLQVRLVIDTRGVAREAQLLPQTISSKPVAGCLETAVTHMSFPAPPQPTTFRVPLLWRRK
jgi:hypothetical protein